MSATLAAMGAALGLIGGSFVGALVRRWPHARSVMHGRSRCEGCGRTLRAAELVPVVSYLALRGKCRSCGAAIAVVQPVAELAGGVAGLLAFAWTPPATAVAGTALALLLLALALLDFEHFWLPDALTLPLFIGGTIAAGWDGRPGTALLSGVAGFLVLEAMRVGYRRWRGREGIGAGDPKLLGAIGVWVGWQALPWVVLGASGLGLACAALGARTRETEVPTKLPLGGFLAVAAWPTWLAEHAI